MRERGSHIVETETVKVLYRVYNECKNYEILSVKYYVSEVDNWIELGKDLGKFEQVINKMVEKDIS